MTSHVDAAWSAEHHAGRAENAEDLALQEADDGSMEAWSSAVHSMNHYALAALYTLMWLLSEET